MRGRVALLATLAAIATVLFTIGPTTHIIWNVSESVPVGLYRLRPIGKFAVPELVAVQPPEPLATFLSQGGYLPRGVPMPGKQFAEAVSSSPSIISKWARRASTTAEADRCRSGRAATSLPRVKSSS
jgi:type IV secretory pathway protease TraF